MTDSGEYNAADITQKLNRFIRTDVHFIWHELPTFDDFERYELALEFIEKLSAAFSTTDAEIIASRLMFYLFPMLPIINYVPNVPFCAELEVNNYGEFHRLAAKHYRHIKPTLNNIATPPVAHYGNKEGQQLIMTCFHKPIGGNVGFLMKHCMIQRNSNS